MPNIRCHSVLRTLMSSTLNIKHTHNYWDEILRLALSIKQGMMMALLMLQKLGSYLPQNVRAVALRKLGSIERILVHPRLATNDDEFILTCDASGNPHDVLKLLPVQPGEKYLSVPADLKFPKMGLIGVNAGPHQSLE